MLKITGGMLIRLVGWLMVILILIGGQTLALPPTPALAGRDNSAAAVPWAVMQPNYQVEVVASGFQLPVNIAFVPNAGHDPDSPYYYVAELFGTIKVVTRAGLVANYASGLLNFDTNGHLPGTGEQGLVGLAVNPANGDVFASLVYASVPFSNTAPRYGEVIRLQSVDGGHSAVTQTVVLDLAGEPQSLTHQISNLTFGPDGKLYLTTPTPPSRPTRKISTRFGARCCASTRMAARLATTRLTTPAMGSGRPTMCLPRVFATHSAVCGGKQTGANISRKTDPITTTGWRG